MAACQPPSLQPSQSFEPLLPRPLNPAWERIQNGLLARPDLNMSKDTLDLLRSVHSAGIWNRDVVTSLAYLSSIACRSVIPGDPPQQSTATAALESLEYNQHVTTLATKCFAAPPRTLRKTAKLACLRCLMTLRTPLEAGWQLQEEVLVDTLRFISEREYDWEYLEHTDEILLWELRAICLHEMDKRREHVVVERVAEGGDAAADFLWKQSKHVQGSMKSSTEVVNSGIERTGEFIKRVIPPSPSSLETSVRAKVVTLAYSGAAKRATNGAMRTSKQAFTHIQQASTQGIQSLASRFQDDQVGEALVPHEPSREVLTAVGKVGIATVGAAAIVGDSFFESTKSVAQTTAATAANVVQHRYGSSAGQVLRDSTDTAFNILGTIPLTHMTVTSFTKSVARNTGKMHLKAYDDNISLDEGEGEEVLTGETLVDRELFPSDPLEGGTTSCEYIFSVSSTATTATVDVHTDVSSDLSSEPLHRRLQERNSIFRRFAACENVNCDDVAQEPSYANNPITESISCDSSLDYSEAGTMEGTYISNDSLLEQDDGIVMIGKMIGQPAGGTEEEFLFQHVFEHAYDEPTELFSHPHGGCDGPLRRISMSFGNVTANRSPMWPQGIYSSIKSRLKL